MSWSQLELYHQQEIAGSSFSIKNEQKVKPSYRVLEDTAQHRLCYSKDAFDIESFERIRNISAEMTSIKSGYSLDHVKNLLR